MSRIHRIYLVFILVLAPSAGWADFSFDEFSAPDLSQLTLVQKAALHGENIRLTAAAEDQAGAIWFTTKQNVAQGFEVSFQFSVTGPYNSFGSADGLAFVIQNDRVEAIGSLGGGLGAAGIPNSLAVKLRHYSGREITVNVGESTLGQVNVGSISDGVIHRVKVVYNPGTMEISYDGQRVLTASVALDEMLDLDGETAWIGLTAATGGAYANHDIYSWSYRDFGKSRAFRRGDASADGTLNIGDAVLTLTALFGSGTLGCLDAADTSDDGRVDLSDAVGSLGYLYLGTLSPARPFEACGLDPTPDDLTCESYPPCS